MQRRTGAGEAEKRKMSKQSQQISALFDGELEDHELDTAFDALRRDEAQRDAWHAYAAISDQLRGEPMARGACVEAVMARVREEPVVLAPRALKPAKQPPAWLALAASLAGVTVVGWLAFANPPGSGDQIAEATTGPMMRLAAVPPAPTFSRKDSTAPVVPPRPDEAEIGDYLLAHHAHASAFRLGDGAQQVRTVSMTAGGARP